MAEDIKPLEILVVDDDASIINLLSRLLTPSHTVATASSGNDGIKKIH